MRASPTDPRDDSELLRRAKRGEDDPAAARAAYESLVARHGAAVVRAVERILESRADAEDIAQDAFLRVYLGLARCPEDASFRAWVRVVATRLALNRLRDHKQARRQLEGAEREPGSAGADEAAETREFVQHLLAALPVAQREILLLRYVEELSVDEIGVALGIAGSATKMRLARARAELGDRLRRDLRD